MHSNVCILEVYEYTKEIGLKEATRDTQIIIRIEELTT